MIDNKELNCGDKNFKNHLAYYLNIFCIKKLIIFIISYLYYFDCKTIAD